MHLFAALAFWTQFDDNKTSILASTCKSQVNTRKDEKLIDLLFIAKNRRAACTCVRATAER